MWYDVIIAVVILFCAARGAAKGLAWQIATIGSLALCFFFAQSGSLAIAPYIKVDPPLNRWLAMLVLYLGASFVAFTAARAVRKTLESWQFVEYDRHLGAVFGLLKGVGFALVITFFMVTLAPTMRDVVLHSYTGHYAGEILTALHPVMPAELHGVIDPYMQDLGQTVVHDDDFPGGNNSPDYGQPPAGNSGFPPVDGSYPPADGEFGPLPDFGPAPSNNSGYGNGNLTGYGSAPRYGIPNAGQPNAVPAGSPANQPATVPKGATSPATPESDLRRIVDALPGLSPEVRQLAWTALQNTKPADRSELIQHFQTAIPGLVKAAATEWQGGKPAAASQLSQRDKTLREIAAIYTVDLAGQKWIIQEAEQRLRGIPDNVALVTVQDWYADLLNLTPDPDPGTSLSTRLEVRIDRQLASFRVPMASLGADVRARLGAEAPAKR